MLENGMACITWRNLIYLLKVTLSFECIMTSKEKVQLYHCRLGLPSFGVVKLIFPSLFKNLGVESLHCEVYELVKHKRVPFPISNEISPSPLFLVHIYVWGPSNVPNILGARWFLTFIDDCTRVTWVVLLKQKSKVSSRFIQFVYD